MIPSLFENLKTELNCRIGFDEEGTDIENGQKNNRILQRSILMAGDELVDKKLTQSCWFGATIKINNTEFW